MAENKRFPLEQFKRDVVEFSQARYGETPVTIPIILAYLVETGEVQRYLDQNGKNVDAVKDLIESNVKFSRVWAADVEHEINESRQENGVGTIVNDSHPHEPLAIIPTVERNLDAFVLSREIDYGPPVTGVELFAYLARALPKRAQKALKAEGPEVEGDTPEKLSRHIGQNGQNKERKHAERAGQIRIFQPGRELARDPLDFSFSGRDEPESPKGGR